MNILFFDTTQTWTFIGIYQFRDELPVKILSEFESENQREASYQLVAQIQNCLQEAKLTRPDLIFIASGPGSFTGVRITVSTARNLSQLWNLPLLGKDSLELYLLANIEKKDEDSTLALDGKQGKHYFKTKINSVFSETIDLDFSKNENQSILKEITPNLNFYIGQIPDFPEKNWYQLKKSELDFRHMIESLGKRYFNHTIETHSYSNLLPNYVRGTYVDQ